MTRSELITSINNSSGDIMERAIAIRYVTENWLLDKNTIPRMEDVLSVCCQVTGCDYALAMSKSRKTHAVAARYLFCYFFRKNFEKVYSLKRLGEFLNDRDHTTVINAISAITDLLAANDQVTLRQVEAVNDGLNGFEFEPIPVQVYVRKPEYVSVKKYLYDKTTGEYYDNVFDLNKSLGIKLTVPFADVKKRFGLFRFEWREVK